MNHMIHRAAAKARRRRHAAISFVRHVAIRRGQLTLNGIRLPWYIDGDGPTITAIERDHPGKIEVPFLFDPNGVLIETSRRELGLSMTGKRPNRRKVRAFRRAKVAEVRDTCGGAH